jgi:hypothetical protein
VAEKRNQLGMVGHWPGGAAAILAQLALMAFVIYVMIRLVNF